MAHSRPRRRKRASATQLYQTCKASGTCPPDIIAKVEQNTLADKILKWGSLGVFFGGLGIGTGSGTGGRTGYVPVQTAPRPAIPFGPTARPPIIVDTVGPSDSSIVSLVEDSTIINSAASDFVPPIREGFEISTSETTTPAILDVSVTTHNTTSTSIFKNPAFAEPSIVQSQPSVEASGHVLTSTYTSTISSHSVEDIPLDTFIVSSSDSNPASSTPVPTPVARPRLGLYSKALQQVQVTNPAFLSSPQRLITFDNPAYEGEDISLQFQHNTIHNPPDDAFMDIVRLHRPAITSRRGIVRFSRIGQRGSMYTRSGKHIGGRVHFYTDISPISAAAEELEMQPLVAAAQDDSGLFDVYVDPTPGPVAVQNMSYPSSTSFVRSSMFTTKWGNTTVPLSLPSNIFAQPGPDIIFPAAPGVPPYNPVIPSLPITPIFISGSQFYLHPSLYLARKRRKRVSLFFADVAA
ncbi:L2 [Pygmy chimpanzee papillomavirus type 1]|uniref:Minor capsid protein L2 n=1 Tax=Pygmy chimpanzee papillomavirus type 1 TaxID=10576 RepID=VL2_PCPV1|nr:RecName: Full=Minor capsid protein L2 [Pygmy chimpanzee papillomavirus type 1]pir/P2WLC1/ L2 protein - pygmy chimpanzee papillomavirus (type 1) [Pygmy chimpanzee papillomavirus type 1]CAA44661.1 L2 [Pygmy chimpanzee papillomavirus type 1]